MRAKLEMSVGRIGLIGDVHAEDQLLERAIAHLQTRPVDLIVHTGDIADGRGSVDRACQLLEVNGVLGVRGNHDRWLLSASSRELPDATPLDAVSQDSLTYLQNLPNMLELQTPRGRALLCHGLGPNDMAQVRPGDRGQAISSNEDLQDLLHRPYFRWILNGHSHEPMVRHFGAVTMINAGTLKREHSPGFWELDFRSGLALRYGFDDAEHVSRPTELTLFARDVFLARGVLPQSDGSAQ